MLESSRMNPGYLFALCELSHEYQLVSSAGGNTAQALEKGRMRRIDYIITSVSQPGTVTTRVSQSVG